MSMANKKYKIIELATGFDKKRMDYNEVQAGSFDQEL